MAIKKKMQMGGEIGAFNKLKGAAKKKELEGYKNYGDGPGSGPSIDKTKKPAPKPKAMVGIRKAKSGGSFPDLNKDGKVTKADILKGRGVIAKNGAAMKKQAAIAIAMKKAGKTPKKMQYGGEAASMKPTGMKKAMMGTGMSAAPIMKKGGSMKKCKYGCK